MYDQPYWNQHRKRWNIHRWVVDMPHQIMSCKYHLNVATTSQSAHWVHQLRTRHHSRDSCTFCTSSLSGSAKAVKAVLLLQKYAQDTGPSSVLSRQSQTHDFFSSWHKCYGLLLKVICHFVMRSSCSWEAVCGAPLQLKRHSILQPRPETFSMKPVAPIAPIPLSTKQKQDIAR